MKSYKVIVHISLLLGILTLFGIILGTAFGKIGFEVGFLSAMCTAFVDFLLLIAAKSIVEAELKIAMRDQSKKPHVQVG